MLNTIENGNWIMLVKQRGNSFLKRKTIKFLSDIEISKFRNRIYKPKSCLISNNYIKYAMDRADKRYPLYIWQKKNNLYDPNYTDRSRMVLSGVPQYLYITNNAKSSSQNLTESIHRNILFTSLRFKRRFLH